MLYISILKVAAKRTWRRCSLEVKIPLNLLFKINMTRIIFLIELRHLPVKHKFLLC